MHVRHALVLSILSSALAACDGGATSRLNNGERGEISLAVAGVPAEHQPFEVLVFVNRTIPMCQEGSCIEEAPIVGMAAGCDDEAVCSIQQQEPTEEGRRCRVVIDAGKAGEARLMIQVETASGELRQDTFLIKVARPTEMEVTCSACDRGLRPGEEAQATCSLFNRDVSADPLLGTCDAWSMGQGVEIVGLGESAPASDGLRLPQVAGQSGTSTARAFGNVFTVRKRLPESAEIVFSGGDVQQRLMAR